MAASFISPAKTSQTDPAPTPYTAPLIADCDAQGNARARLAAIKAVKRDMQAQGLKPVHIERRIIVSAANDYLRDHPELIEVAEAAN